MYSAYRKKNNKGLLKNINKNKTKNGKTYYVSRWVTSTFNLLSPNNSMSLMDLFKNPKNIFKVTTVIHTVSMKN